MEAAVASAASGNLVIGYGTDSHLCLDCDFKPEDEVTEFSARAYAEFMPRIKNLAQVQFKMMEQHAKATK